MRFSDSTISRPFSSGVPPPTRPVLPPCGTTATFSAAHSPTTAATSPVLAGRTTASALPAKFSRQSVT